MIRILKKRPTSTAEAEARGRRDAFADKNRCDLVPIDLRRPAESDAYARGYSVGWRERAAVVAEGIA